MFLMRQRASRYRLGFSLVEVLVALTVLAIGMTASTPLFLRSLSQVRRIEEMTLGTQIVRNLYSVERAANKYYSTATIEELLRVTGSSWVLEPCVDPVTEKIRLRWVVVEYKAPVVYYRRIYYVEMSGGGVEPFVTYITPLPFN